MAISYGKLSEVMSRLNGPQNKARNSARMADFVETLSLVVVLGALAGLGLIVVALLMSWLTAAHSPDLLQHAFAARSLR